ncbi:hypothetical protein EO95_14685 [Methanosarcina sp. 1.H.T.1A.1]|uniref:hypothetical protein n=1 Tax=Methanosarcina sp. 1.H.T.1A.1 TaxID=1483602 RepID=UPI0006223F83|nr:hypothetical protein [Methanosarcina sp. 1.H.T.1A.1]KKI00467.1 hypothetical protein EO95_14685 [Methanosarcina sp. 1.H.T.1A.1]
MDVNNELRSSGLNYDFFDPTTLFTVPYLFFHSRRRRAVFQSNKGIKKKRKKERKKERKAEKVRATEEACK